MKRKIVKIDEAKCLGCGLCARACHESAIEITGGKARLVRDDYCDGLGNCLPHCPAGAISFEERETVPYDKSAVAANKLEKKRVLKNWPVQIKLAPPKADYFDGAELLLAADCTAFACAGFHEKFVKNRVVLTGCPKLDGVDYSEKLAEIFKNNDIKALKTVRMEVPCCGGFVKAVETALEKSGKDTPNEVCIVSVSGDVKK